MSDAFFSIDGDGFVPQVHATGPWSPDYLHGGPPCALATRALERSFPDDFQLTRLTFELLRPVGFSKLTLRTQVDAEGANVRRGTTVLEADGKPLIRAQAMAFRRVPVALELPGEPPPPLPATLAPSALPFFPTPVGYHTAMELRYARGELGRSPVAAWLRMKVPLLAGEKPSPFVRTVCAADSGNGVAQVVDFKAFTFVNADLTLTFLRRPKGEWICLEAHTLATKDGVGLTDTRLWDETGPVGRGTQSLVVRPRTVHAS
ncbi:MAG: thioesterase family protein [Myxococcota bacterium]